jgi:AcrR family transcriptional regulator
LDAALKLVVQEGVEALTFENLAAKSKMTKGGVLYHFRSRENLDDALRQHVRGQYDDAWRRAADKLPDSQTRMLEGWVRFRLGGKTRIDAAAGKMMTSRLSNVEETQSENVSRFSEMAEVIGFERAALLYLAVEGLWFLELAGFSPFNDEERRHVTDRIIEVVHLDRVG